MAAGGRQNDGTERRLGAGGRRARTASRCLVRPSPKRRLRILAARVVGRDCRARRTAEGLGSQHPHGCCHGRRYARHPRVRLCGRPSAARRVRRVVHRPTRAVACRARGTSCQPPSASPLTHGQADAACSKVECVTAVPFRIRLRGCLQGTQRHQEEGERRPGRHHLDPIDIEVALPSRLPIRRHGVVVPRQHHLVVRCLPHV